MFIRYYYSFDGVIFYDKKFNVKYDSFKGLLEEVNKIHREHDYEKIKKAYWTDSSKIIFVLKGGI